jgi:hypothetical protein
MTGERHGAIPAGGRAWHGEPSRTSCWTVCLHAGSSSHPCANPCSVQANREMPTAKTTHQRVRGSCTFSLRIIQSLEKQVASLRFTDLGGGTRDGARPAVPHTFAAWTPGALCEPDLGLAPAPRGPRGVHLRTSRFQVSSISRPAPPVRTGHRNRPRLPCCPVADYPKTGMPAKGRYSAPFLPQSTL